MLNSWFKFYSAIKLNLCFYFLTERRKIKTKLLALYLSMSFLIFLELRTIELKVFTISTF